MSNPVQIIPDEHEYADKRPTNTHNTVHSLSHSEEEVLQVMENESNTESKPYPIEGMSRLIDVEKDLTVFTSNDIDQLTFFSKSLEDFAELAQTSDSMSFFTFKSEMCRVHTMTSSRLNFTLPGNSFVYYQNRKRVTLPVHALTNVRLFDCTIHNITFRIFMIFCRVNPGRKINTNYVTNVVYGNVIQDLNDALSWTLSRILDEPPDADTEPLENMPRFHSKNPVQTESHTGTSRVTHGYKETRLSPAACKEFLSQLTSKLKDTTRYPLVEFVMSSCDLKNTIKESGTTLRHNESGVPGISQRSVTSDLNSCLKLGHASQLATLRKMFRLLFESRSIKCYYDYAVNVSASSSDGTRYTILNKMEPIRDSQISPVFTPKDVENFQVESEHPPEWHDLCAQRMNIVHIITRLQYHAPGHDQLAEIDFGSALRDQNMSTSYDTAWACLNEKDDAMATLRNNFWKNVKTCAISIGYEPNIWEGYDVEAERTSLGRAFTQRHGYLRWQNTLNAGSSILIAYIHNITTNNAVCIDTGMVDHIKIFSDSILSVLSNETFLEVMNKFLMMVCRLDVKPSPTIDNLDDEPLLITQPDAMDDESPLITQPDPTVIPNDVEEEESYTVYETEPKPSKSRGTKYPKFFMTEFGNFHTGNPVIDTFQDDEIIDGQWLNFELGHPKQDKPLGFQLYLSPLKNIAGKFEYRQWSHLHALPIYLLSMLHETGILPSHKSTMIRNMCEMRTLTEYLTEEYCKELSLRKLSTRVEFMMCLHNTEVGTDGCYEFAPDMKFDEILHTIEHKKLCSYMRKQLNTFVAPLHKLLGEMQRYNDGPVIPLLQIPASCKTAYFVLAEVLAREFSDDRASRISLMRASAAIEEKGYVHIPESLGINISSTVKDQTLLEYGVKPSIISFQNVSELSTVVLCGRFDHTRYVPTFLEDNKNKLLETLRNEVHRPITYVHATTMVLSILQHYAGAGEGSTKIYSYFDDVEYKKLGKLNPEKMKEMTYKLFLVVARVYREDWRELLFCHHNKLGKKNMSAKEYFPGTITELQVFLGLESNCNCKLNCPYLTKNYGSHPKLVSEITTAEDMIAMAFNTIDPEQCTTTNKSWQGLTSRRLAMYVMMHLNRIIATLHSEGANVPPLDLATINSLLWKAMLTQGRHKNDKSPSIIWRTKPSRMGHYKDGVAIVIKYDTRSHAMLPTRKVSCEEGKNDINPTCHSQKKKVGRVNHKKCSVLEHLLGFTSPYRMQYQFFLLSHYRLNMGNDPWPTQDDCLLGTTLRARHFYPEKKVTRWQRII